MRPLLLLASLSLAAACAPQEAPPPVSDPTSASDAAESAPSASPSGTSTGSLDVCSRSNEEGCPCSEAGASDNCKVTRHVGGYTTCELGLRTCGQGGAWGPCEGAGIYTGE